VAPFGLVEPVERAQQVAEGVAQLAILVGDAGQDFLADAVILGEIDRQRPQADDVRAVGRASLQRAIVLPSDLDIFMPLASMVKPWVSTAL
jgi:hypothetical protein